MFVIAARGFALMRLAPRAHRDRELVMRCALKAVLWAPWAEVFGILAAFLLPFDLPEGASFLLGFLAVASPFVTFYYKAKNLS